MFLPDRNAFKEYDFVAEMQGAINEERVETETTYEEKVEEDTVEEEQLENNEPKEKTPKRQVSPLRQQTAERRVTPEKQITPAVLMSVPTASKVIIEKRITKCGKAAVVTSTPYKEEIEASIEKRNLPSNSGVKRKIEDSKPSQQKKIKHNRKKKIQSVAIEKANKRKLVSWSFRFGPTGRKL
nr:uncharacterized protein LOC111516173 [Leptinotarsa decemlineata]